MWWRLYMKQLLRQQVVRIWVYKLVLQKTLLSCDEKLMHQKLSQETLRLGAPWLVTLCKLLFLSQNDTIVFSGATTLNIDC